MNERIKQLAEKANIEFTYDPTETPVRAFVECWEDDLEKFVDMIVRECIDWCNANARDDGTAQRIAEDIKKDFGVAE